MENPGQENLGRDICGFVLEDCFTVGIWAKVRPCEAVLGGLLGSNTGGLSDRVVSSTVVSWSAARMSFKPESEEAAVVDSGLGG